MNVTWLIFLGKQLIFMDNVVSDYQYTMMSVSEKEFVKKSILLYL
jgi:hypothetical protein